MSMGRSEITIRVKYDRNRFKDYIRAWLKAYKINPVGTDWVRAEGRYALPPVSILEDIAERMSRLAAYLAEQERLHGGKPIGPKCVESWIGGRDKRLDYPSPPAFTTIEK